MRNRNVRGRREAIVVVEGRDEIKDSLGYPRHWDIYHVDKGTCYEVGWVVPRENDDGVFHVNRTVRNSEDREVLFYDKKSRNKLARIRNSKDGLYSKFLGMFAGCDYETRVLDVIKVQEGKIGEVVGITPYRDGAERVARRVAVGLGQRLAYVRGLDFIDRSGVNFGKLETLVD